jgi:uncharacterized protein (UPF0332 family)
MKPEYISSLWNRAVKTLLDARMSMSHSPDTAANRAYYSAFYAVSALFAEDGKYFKKHTGLRSAVHKELVHAGRWSENLGTDFDQLMTLREIADYGVIQHVSEKEAEGSLARAERILEAVHNMNPVLFPLSRKEGAE